MGSLLVDSILDGDLLVVQAVAMLWGVLFIGIGLGADILANFYNPRLKKG